MTLIITDKDRDEKIEDSTRYKVRESDLEPIEELIWEYLKKKYDRK